MFTEHFSILLFEGYLNTKYEVYGLEGCGWKKSPGAKRLIWRAKLKLLKFSLLKLLNIFKNFKLLTECGVLMNTLYRQNRLFWKGISTKSIKGFIIYIIGNRVCCCSVIKNSVNFNIVWVEWFIIKLIINKKYYKNQQNSKVYYLYTK